MFHDSLSLAEEDLERIFLRAHDDQVAYIIFVKVVRNELFYAFDVVKIHISSLAKTLLS